MGKILILITGTYDSSDQLTCPWNQHPGIVLSYDFISYATTQNSDPATNVLNFLPTQSWLTAF